MSYGKYLRSDWVYLKALEHSLVSGRCACFFLFFVFSYFLFDVCFRHLLCLQNVPTLTWSSVSPRTWVQFQSLCSRPECYTLGRYIYKYISCWFAAGLPHGHTSFKNIYTKYMTCCFASFSCFSAGMLHGHASFYFIPGTKYVLITCFACFSCFSAGVHGHQALGYGRLGCVQGRHGQGEAWRNGPPAA